MQKLSTILLSLLVVFSTLLSAKVIDLEKSKGIDQDLIISLNPHKAQKDVSQDTEIKVKFDTELDEKHVKKHDVKLKLITLTKESMIDGSVSYIAEEKAVLFKPNKALQNGYYEVEFKSLKAIKKKKINNIKYRFYVPETINGYKLPPEPDATINNSTLLGIDFNDNGVRDDVELYIIKRFAKDPEFPKIKTAIAMQYAWASQKILENPTIESSKFEDDAISCKFYWIRKSAKSLTTLETMQFGVKHKIYDSEVKDNIYNTRARIERKFEYNSALSGNIFQGRKNTIDMCQTNINVLGE